MNTGHFIDYAKSFGYDIKFAGVGMAYITIGNVKLTETMDIQTVTNMLIQIGVAIVVDTMRAEDY